MWGGVLAWSAPSSTATRRTRQRAALNTASPPLPPALRPLPVFAAIHPLLLWGTAAVVVPVLIHLLLRQRPRPRPWAAMRWLQAAMQRAQRRYKLTNLLLLLLRCLIILLVALALARPSLAGLGSGGDLVLIIDATASMGARSADPGPLATATAALAKAVLPGRVTVIAVSDRPRLLVDGNADEARDALTRLTADPLPGGLDRAASAGQADTVLAACGATADVVLVSDFQQDDGDLLAALLSKRVRSVKRWAVGQPAPNAVVTGIETMPDLLPGQPGELMLAIAGQAGPVRVSVDGGPLTPAGEGARVALPPLESGDHRLAVELTDQGLAYDNRIELPLRVRGAVPTVVAREHADYLGAALEADQGYFELLPDRHPLRVGQLATENLPPRGLVALRGRSGDGKRLHTWATGGGVLWTTLSGLRDEPAFAATLATLVNGEAVAAAPFRSGDSDLDEVLSTALPTQALRRTTLPTGAEAVLWAGATPLVVALPIGRGWLILELIDLGQEPSFAARGTTPLWVRRIARRYLARIDAPRLWEAGSTVPVAAVLRRAGLVQTVAAGDPLIAAPGAWQVDDAPPVVVLPSRAEARLDKRPPTTASANLDETLPGRAGADWGVALLIAALAVLIGEGLFAAWAARTYGR